MDARRFEEILSTGTYTSDEVKNFSSEQVSEVLKSDKDELTIKVVGAHVLTPEQQMLLLEKEDVGFLLAYLCPGGVFDKNRRFAEEQEKVFLSLLDKFIREVSQFPVKILYDMARRMEIDYCLGVVTKEEVLEQIDTIPMRIAELWIENGLLDDDLLQSAKTFLLPKLAKMLIEYDLLDFCLLQSAKKILLVNLKNQRVC